MAVDKTELAIKATKEAVDAITQLSDAFNALRRFAEYRGDTELDFNDYASAIQEVPNLKHVNTEALDALVNGGLQDLLTSVKTIQVTVGGQQITLKKLFQRLRT